MKEWTHSDLVERGARWLDNVMKCCPVLTETSSYSGEMPDVIGWKMNGRSILLECKASRGDFHADGLKPHRKHPEIALGAERWYFAPAGLIKPEEVPADWGLAEVKGNGVHVVVPARPRKDLRSDISRTYEMRLMVSTLKRMAIRVSPVKLRDWLKYECREIPLEEMQRLAREEEEPQLTPEERKELDRLNWEAHQRDMYFRSTDGI